MRATVAALSLLILPIVAGAHHSRAEFPNDAVELEGEIIEVGWRNPHPVLTVKTVDDSGEEKLWKVESWQSANALDRKGVPGRELFQVGDHVTVAGRESVRRPDVFLGTNVRLDDDREAALQPGLESYWGGPVVGAAEASATRIATGGEARGIFRVWTYESGSRSVVPDELPLTAAARQKVSTFDELVDHPQWRCQPEGMPLVMDSGYPIEFVEQGDIISLRLERTDATRTIHMGADAGDRTPTLLGYSAGQWEGDTLVVTTNGISYPYFDDDGTPQTESVEIVERFALNESQNGLAWTATFTDPNTFTAPVGITASWRWVPGEAIKPWNCAFFD